MASAIASAGWTRSADVPAFRDVRRARTATGFAGLRRGLARFWSGRPAPAAAVDQFYRDGFDAGFNGETPDAVRDAAICAWQEASWLEGYDAGLAAWLHW